MKRLALILSLALLPAALHAATPTDEMIPVKAGNSPKIRPDRAYLLFRTPRFKGVPAVEPALLRVPTASEIQRFEQAKQAAYDKALPGLMKDYQKAREKYAAQVAQGGPSADPVPQEPSLDRFAFAWDEVGNLQTVDFGDAFVKADEENTYLVETLPGNYVLYGLSLSMGLPRLLVCFCLGTVGFEAKAGEITDMGYLYGDVARTKSEVPYLAAESGYGPSSDVGLGVLMAGTIRPVRPDSSRPAGIAANQVVTADYHAVGKYFTPNALGINRLVPVPGILDYKGGDVIDVKTGQVVPDNF
jgi:hypothetical protein